MSDYFDDLLNGAEAPQEEKKLSLHLGIYLKNEPENLVGIAEFYNYDADRRKVSIGIRLDSGHWGCGIAKSAIGLMLNYALNKTDIKRLTAHIMSANVRSAAAVKSLGFRIRSADTFEDWGFEEPVLVNKFIYEK